MVESDVTFLSYMYLKSTDWSHADHNVFYPKSSLTKELDNKLPSLRILIKLIVMCLMLCEFLYKIILSENRRRISMVYIKSEQLYPSSLVHNLLDYDVKIGIKMFKTQVKPRGISMVCK